MRTGRCKRALRARLANTVTLLRLDSAEVIASSRAMIDKIALPEGLLEILTGFPLEPARVLSWGLHAGARALIAPRLAFL